jgi:hypothetical protein
LLRADAVLTRSKKAIKIHLNNIEGEHLEKFSVVTNGRNVNFFKPDATARKQLRNFLKVTESTKVFVYCGSLGPQYCWDEMLSIFMSYHEINSDSKFLILTGNVSFANERIPTEIKDHIVVKNISFEEVPKYLSGVDIAFALRKPKYSMTAVDPIKVGEYVLMGLPIIASKGIGDSEKLLKKNTNCFLYDHHSSQSTDKAIEFIQYLDSDQQDKIRAFGIENYSIEKSASTYIKSLNLLK